MSNLLAIRINWSATQAALGLLISCLPAFAADRCESKANQAIDWTAVSRSMIERVPFREVENFMLAHPVERRGLVEVPLDYDQPLGPSLKIFFRLLPSASEELPDPWRPLLVVMNGGPGMPSSAYRSLDFDYGGDDVDALTHLAKHFRLVLIDQRGTGLSSPLNLDNPGLPAPAIARLFDSDEHALDHAQVIERVNPSREPFFVLARSYGGEIGFQDLLSGDRVSKPAGMIFSSSILPHSDALDSFLARRQKQLELNLQFAAEAPAAVEKLGRLRQRAKQLDLHPGTVNFLWAELGGPEGWERQLEDKIDHLLTLDEREALQSALGGTIVESVNLLNYLLSSAALTPGYTDRTITVQTSRKIPFQGWMLDENWTLQRLGTDGSWRECFVDAVDRSPPPPTSFPEPAEIRRALSEIPVLFTFGAEDAFVPGELQLQRARILGDPGRTDYVLLQGGHGSAFSAEGARILADWTAELLEKQEGGTP